MPDTSWFTDARFGMFIHWGLYSMLARHEWVKSAERISNEVYDAKYFKRFDPDLYDPNAWADVAAAAGMKYFVITTKHHEGFCLWDTKLTDHKSTNTPAGRDLLTPMVQAFRDRNMRVGFYHSLIDWHHPQFVIDPVFGPHRDDPKRDEMNKTRDQSKYCEYLHGQVRELLTQFGKVDLLWVDFSYPNRPGGKGRDDWQSEKLIKLIRELQPQILVDDRLDLPGSWDFKTPEQFQPREWVTDNGQRVVWEACQTFSGSWGYHRDEFSWKSIEQLVQMLCDTVSKGGNLLLNVGPNARGEFDDRALDRLRGMGRWMHLHSRSIYGCTQAPDEFVTPQDCRLTWNPKTRRMYVHVFAWPFVQLHMDGFAGKVDYAQLLNDGSEIRLEQRDYDQHGGDKPGDKRTLTLRLPVNKPDVTVPVIELFMK